MGGDPCKDIGKLQHNDAHVHRLTCVFSYLFFPAVVSLHVGEYINGGFCFMKATFTFAHGNYTITEQNARAIPTNFQVYMILEIILHGIFGKFSNHKVHLKNSFK